MRNLSKRPMLNRLDKTGISIGNVGFGYAMTTSMGSFFSDVDCYGFSVGRFDVVGA